MAMYRIRKSSVDPEATTMADAHERALINLGITDRSDPQVESVALGILQLMRMAKWIRRNWLILPVRLSRRPNRATQVKACKTEDSLATSPWFTAPLDHRGRLPKAVLAGAPLDLGLSQPSSEDRRQPLALSRSRVPSPLRSTLWA